MNHNTSKKTKFKAIIHSGPMLSMDMFQVNVPHFDIPKNDQWIIDGGVQLEFPKGFISIGWSQQYGIFISEPSDFKSIYKGTNYIILNERNSTKINIPKSRNVGDALFKWFSFEYYDPNTSTFKKDTALLDLKLNLGSGNNLQIAAIDYTLTEDNIPTDYSYDLTSALLISLNNPIKIEFKKN